MGPHRQGARAIKTITKTHLAIDSRKFHKNQRAGLYEPPTNSLSLHEIAPGFEHFRDLLARVGAPWGWDKQDRYERQILHARLEDPQTRLFMLRDGELDVGYALVVGVNQSVMSRFWPQANQPRVIEIENLGLFPGEEGGGRGWGFFQLVMNDLFESSDVVYWSMSSSNYPTLLNYYLNQGMEILAQDVVPDPRYKHAVPGLRFG